MSSFNSLSSHLKFNEKFFPVQFAVQLAQQMQMKSLQQLS